MQPPKLNIYIVEKEIQGVMASEQVNRLKAKYMIYQTLLNFPEQYEFETDDEKELIMNYLSPVRTLH